jgi:predicted metal-dependent hydrolase
MPPFEAEMRVHPRAIRLGLRVHPGGRVVVTVPPGASPLSVERFMRRYRAWVERARERMSRFQPRPSRKEARQAYAVHKEAARRLAYAKIAQFAPLYGVSVSAVSIRDQKTRWGSCSRNARLSFNYRIALLPERLAEYIVVHELCHLLAFDHSARFWALVARAVPEHKSLRKTLHAHHRLHA